MPFWTASAATWDTPALFDDFPANPRTPTNPAAHAHSATSQRRRMGSPSLVPERCILQRCVSNTEMNDASQAVSVEQLRDRWPIGRERNGPITLLLKHLRIFHPFMLTCLDFMNRRTMLQQPDRELQGTARGLF